MSNRVDSAPAAAPGLLNLVGGALRRLGRALYTTPPTRSLAAETMRSPISTFEDRCHSLELRVDRLEGLYEQRVASYQALEAAVVEGLESLEAKRRSVDAKLQRLGQREQQSEGPANAEDLDYWRKRAGLRGLGG